MKHRFVSLLRVPNEREQRDPRHSFILMGCCLLVLATLLVGLSLQVGTHAHHTAHAQAPNNGNMPVGLNVGPNAQSMNDMIEYDPRFGGVNNGALTEDANGNLSSDFEWVLDNRYALAWVPGATDVDPLKFSEDLSGNYTLTFTGQASLSIDNAGDPAHAAMSISNQSYDASTNTTTATVTFGNPSGGIVGGIQFTNTKRSPSDAAGDGVTDLHLWVPGYKTASNPVFTDLWLNSIKNYNWSALRFMGALGTNDYANPASQEVYPYRLNWSTDRLQPGKGPAYGYNHVGVHGSYSWEEVVLVAQLTHKDIWINIPVNASDDYVAQAANLLKNGDQYTNNQGIPDDVNVYVEYSNEMWHYGFNQGAWNNQAAQDEVKAGGSNLDYDNNNNANDSWRFRRIAKRTIEIGNTFKQAFNDNGTRIRPVINNAWVGNDIDILKYVTDNYGPPSGVLYGIAQTGYYSSTDRSSVQSILTTMKASSDANVRGYIQSRTIATYYGLHSLTYESGEGDTQQKADGSGNETDQELYNQFAASRDPGMQDVEMHDLTNWFQSGGDLYMQFGQVGHFSIYGFWTLSEDLTNQTTGKWKGYIQAMNTPKPAVTAGVVLPNSSPTVVQASGYQYYAEGPQGNPGAGNFLYGLGSSHLTWLLNVTQSGTYTFTPNVSANDGTGQIKVSLDNQAVTTVNIPNTGYDQGPWQDTAPVTLNLSAGLHAVRIDGIPNTSGWSLRQVTFATVSTNGGTGSTQWTFCANENGTCSFSGTMVVRYGANGYYAYQTLTNGTPCNNATFGDPDVGTFKACYTAPVPPTGWTQCASEGGTCTVPDTVTVAYGANGKFAYQTVSGSTGCNNGVFGDPNYGTVKACYYL